MEKVSHETMRKTLKNELKPHLIKQWVIPPEHNTTAFVWRMEEILELYEELYDPKRPVVCFAMRGPASYFIGRCERPSTDGARRAPQKAR